MGDVINLQYADDDPRKDIDSPAEEKASMVSVLNCHRSDVSVIMCAAIGRL